MSLSKKSILKNFKKLSLDTDFQSHAPLLDAVFENDDYAWSGGLGIGRKLLTILFKLKKIKINHLKARKITRYNIDRKTEDNIGQHEEAVKCLVKSREHNFIISGDFKCR